MKVRFYSAAPLFLDKKTACYTEQREVFESHIKAKKQTLVALITTKGLKSTIWSEELIQNVVTLEDLLEF